MIKKTPEETEFLCKSLLSTWMVKKKVPENSTFFLKGYDSDDIEVCSLELPDDNDTWGTLMAGCLYNFGYSGAVVIKFEDSNGNIIGEIEIN